MKFLKPENLGDAREIIDRIAESGGEHKGLIQSIQELSDKTERMIAIWDVIIDVGCKVWNVLEEVIYCFSHPLEFFGALQPWFLLALFAAVILKSIGFDVDKYIALIVILLVLAILC